MFTVIQGDRREISENLISPQGETLMKRYANWVLYPNFPFPLYYNAGVSKHGFGSERVNDNTHR